MSAADVDLVRGMYDRVNEGDTASSGEMLHPEAEWHQNPELPDASSYRGREEFREGLMRFLDEFEDVRFDVVEDATAEEVRLRIHLSGRRRAIGVEVERGEVFHVWGLRDGMPFRCRVLLGEEESLRAAGLER